MRARSPKPAHPSEPPPREDLSPGEERFVEAMGLYFEKSGVARIGGRSLGLLMISEGPVSLDRMAEVLHVSRASISTNMRQFTQTGLCEQFSIPGDRRHFYFFADGAWHQYMRRSMDSLRSLNEILGAGMAALPSECPRARARLRQTSNLFEFFSDEIASLLDRWEAKSAQPSTRDSHVRHRLHQRRP